MARRTTGERTPEQAAEDERYFASMRRAMHEIRPVHTRKYARFERPWYIAQQIEFAKAMRAAGEFARDAELAAPLTSRGRPLALLQEAAVNAP
jgi:hypothetical protein